jgi:hypothetical protein
MAQRKNVRASSPARNDPQCFIGLNPSAGAEGKRRGGSVARDRAPTGISAMEKRPGRTPVAATQREGLARKPSQGFCDCSRDH